MTAAAVSAEPIQFEPGVGCFVIAGHHCHPYAGLELIRMMLETGESFDSWTLDGGSRWSRPDDEELEAAYQRVKNNRRYAITKLITDTLTQHVGEHLYDTIQYDKKTRTWRYHGDWKWRTVKLDYG